MQAKNTLAKTKNLRRGALYLTEPMAEGKVDEAESGAEVDWVEGKINDRTFISNGQGTANKRHKLTVLIAKTASENNGKLSETDMGLIEATIIGIQDVESLEKQLKEPA